MSGQETKTTDVVAFKNICNFVNDLGSHYGKKYKPVKLYRRILNETQISHDKAIQKNIELFRQFCLKNREAIQEMDKAKLVQKTIVYSEKVYIDIEHIFNISLPENVNIIWQHLLTISSILDPNSKAMEVLKQMKTSNNSKEANFLANIINKVETKFGKNTNPNETIGSMMQSGIFTELLTDMQKGLSSGELNIAGLFGTVQGMMNSMQEQAGDDPEAKQAFGMINNMTSMFGSMMSGNSTATPDPQMLSGMMSMMSGLSSTNVPSTTSMDVVQSHPKDAQGHPKDGQSHPNKK